MKKYFQKQRVLLFFFSFSYLEKSPKYSIFLNFYINKDFIVLLQVSENIVSCDLV